LNDIKSVLGTLDSNIKTGLFNSGAKMLIVKNEDELESNIEFFTSLLPVEAIFTDSEGVDETLPTDEHYGVSSTKLELMYLIVYYSLLTEESLSEQYTALKAAYAQASEKAIFTPGEAYQDGHEDDIHQNASEKNALKYGSYLYNLTQLYFGNDKGQPGEFTISTKAELKTQNALGYTFMEKYFSE
jgi:hypothetical protein